MLHHAPSYWSPTRQGRYPRRSDPEFRQAMKHMLEAGYTHKRIGEVLGMTERTSEQLAQKLGIARSRGFDRAKIPDKAIGQVKALVDEGKLNREIAEVFHCSDTTVTNYLRRHDVQATRPYKPRAGNQVIPLDAFPAIRALWESGVKQEEIGKLYGVTQTAISRYMGLYGLVLMNRGKRKLPLSRRYYPLAEPLETE